jgi:hypothetical protein
MGETEKILLHKTQRRTPNPTLAKTMKDFFCKDSCEKELMRLCNPWYGSCVRGGVAVEIEVVETGVIIKIL